MSSLMVQCFILCVTKIIPVSGRMPWLSSCEISKCTNTCTHINLKLGTYMPTTFDKFLKTPGSSCLIPLPSSWRVPVHAGALHVELRVSVPLKESKKLQADDVHVATCTSTENNMRECLISHSTAWFQLGSVICIARLYFRNIQKLETLQELNCHR
jgi:hypothetical protein